MPPSKNVQPKLTISAGPVINTAGPSGGVTARVAAGLQDMKLPISPRQVPVRTALQNLAKAINISFEGDFLENELEGVFKSARIKDGAVEIQHEEYIGLGDGILANIGKVGRSLVLTLRGPDPASPEGEKAFKEKGYRPVSGLLNLVGRKLNLLQEFEKQLPSYVQQLLDRLEAANMIVGWNRDEWTITTKVIGLDVVIRPVEQPVGKKN